MSSHPFIRSTRSFGASNLVVFEVDGAPNIVYATATGMRAYAEAINAGELTQSDMSVAEVMAAVEEMVQSATPQARTSFDELDIDSEIGPFGITSKDVRDFLKSTDQPVQVRINSPGGEVFSSIAIYNALREYPARVTALVDPLAASAASFIALAADHTVMAPHSQMMIHDAWGIAAGNADDMLRAASFLDRQSEVIAGIYAERTGKPSAHWRELMAQETWFSAQESVDAGLAHEVGGPSSKKARNSYDLSLFAKTPRPELPPKNSTPAQPEEQPETDQPIRIDWRIHARHKVAAAMLGE